MRSLVILVVLAACRIPDETFTPIGGGDGGGGDGGGGGDASIDAPMIPASNAFLLDMGNLIRLNVDMGGALSVTSVTAPVNGAAAVVVNRQGTFVFVAEAMGASTGTLREFQNGATLTGTANQRTLSCLPRVMVLHPMGGYLAIGCDAPRIIIVPLNAAGQIDLSRSINEVMLFAGNAVTNLAFSPSGCLVAIDPDAPTKSFTFDLQTGVANMISMLSVGPSNPRGLAVHPSGAFVYVAGADRIDAIALDAACSLNATGDSRAIAEGTSVVVAPTDRIFIAGGTQATPRFYSFTLTPTGQLGNQVNGSPFAAFTTQEALVADPSRPNLVYVASRGYMGAYPITIDANGRPTQTPTGATTAAPSVVGFALGR